LATLLQRPDKLRVIRVADGPSSEFYYDGKTMLAFAPVEKLVPIADAPATIDRCRAWGDLPRGRDPRSPT
jgi:hypothetical protein